MDTLEGCVNEMQGSPSVEETQLLSGRKDTLQAKTLAVCALYQNSLSTRSEEILEGAISQDEEKTAESNLEELPLPNLVGNPLELTEPQPPHAKRIVSVGIPSGEDLEQLYKSLDGDLHRISHGNEVLQAALDLIKDNHFARAEALLASWKDLLDIELPMGGNDKRQNETECEVDRATCLLKGLRLETGRAREVHEALGRSGYQEALEAAARMRDTCLDCKVTQVWKRPKRAGRGTAMRPSDQFRNCPKFLKMNPAEKAARIESAGGCPKFTSWRHGPQDCRDPRDMICKAFIGSGVCNKPHLQMAHGSRNTYCHANRVFSFSAMYQQNPAPSGRSTQASNFYDDGDSLSSYWHLASWPTQKILINDF